MAEQSQRWHVLTTLHALHNFPCEHFHPQQCDIVSSHLRQCLKRPCVALRCCWHRKAIVMIDCGHMWRLWSGYNSLHWTALLWLWRGGFYLFFLLPASCKTNDVLFSVWYDNSTLITTPLCFWSLAAAWRLFCCCYIVYGEGQSRVCTWLFRWWFTYILSSWVIEWLSRFPFMRKVAIYGWSLRQAISSLWILLWTGIICWSPLALVFNTLQLYSNYFECMHYRF